MSRGPRLAYQPALDGIRALAVLAVIAYHFDYGWAQGGFLGVDAFFVLSGYLITSLLLLEWGEGRGIGLLGFWGRRIRRLLPALLLLLLAVAIYAQVALEPVQLDKVRGDGLASLFYVANWRFIVAGQSYFDLFSADSPLRHMWSLAIEEQFYLVWPLVVVACLTWFHGSRRVLAGITVAGIVASTALMALLYESSDPSRAYFGTDSRMHTILVGCLLAMVLLRWRVEDGRARVAIHAVAAVAAVGVLASWFLVSDTAAGYYHGGSLVYAIAVALVIASVVQREPTALRAGLVLAPLVWIGRISYGLYLWHYPINVVATPSRVGVDGVALTAVRLGLTFAIATASFYLVERPVRMGALHGRVAVAAGTAAAIVTGAALIVTTSGAQTPPTFVGGGFNQPSVCPPQNARELRLAERALTPEDAAAPVDDAPQILVVGDSIACSLLSGLRSYAQVRDVPVASGAVIACGVASGEIAPSADGPRLTNECEELVRRTQDQAIADADPDVVAWLSAWEKEDQVVDGRVVAFDSPEGRALLDERLETAYERLTANGAHLVLLLEAPRAPSDFFGTDIPTDPVEDARTAELNRRLRSFAARHPAEVSVIDLSEQLCPSGPPCPEVVDGIVPRPYGGNHLNPDAAVWLSRWLLPQLVDAGPRTRP